MKKLIALLLVVCMIAGLFVACGKKKPAVKDPTTASTATEATKAPEATEATEATKAPEATEGTESTEATEATGESEATEATEATKAPEQTEAKDTKPTTTKPTTAKPTTAKPTAAKPTAAVKPTTGNKVTSATKAPTKATEPKNTTKATQPTATQSTKPVETKPVETKPAGSASMPYKGKTLQIYGMGDPESMTDFSQFNEYFTWMQKAAAAEWAEMNGVTLEFKGKYDQNTVLSAINSGERPDVIYHSNGFPAIANNGIVAQFTDAEYKKLADICGTEWLDMMKYGTKSTGFVVPWTGTMMCYYNKTMFEEYGVTTPKEHFLAGNWTWDTLLQTMEAMTQDVNSDGKTDTYGLNGASWANIVNPWAHNDKGELISTIDEPWMQDFFQLKYDAYTVKKVTMKGANRITTNVIYPMFAMEFSDCEPYNFEHLYQTAPNGNEIEVAPMPEWRGDNGKTLATSKVTQQAFHLASSCDERDAAVDMLAYILKCGLKYVSDYSLGAVKSEYAGLQGTSQLSANYLTAFAKMINRRQRDVNKLIEDEIYDAEYITKINEYLNKRSKFIYGDYAKVDSLTSYDEITEMPPNSSIPAIKQKYQNSIDTYNKTYINK